MSPVASAYSIRSGRKLEQLPTLYEVRPLEDSRWKSFVQRHPRASVFHSEGWLEALRRTYGFEPVAFTTSPPGVDLKDGFVFCRIASWLTGRRLVSLPFSDHCDPLINDGVDVHAVISALDHEFSCQKLRYFEIRPMRSLQETTLYHSRHIYCLHRLDLRPELDTLFKTFHKDSTQRKIRRAEREGLTYEEGQSQALLDVFWELYIATRRRHMSPPQPKQWFQHLIDCLGRLMKIRVALKDGRPVAAIITIQSKETLVFKYGCSDVRFNNLGGTHLLFWTSIQEAKREGMLTFDLGRSNSDDGGLITFKDRWGARRSELIYLRFTTSHRSSQSYRGNYDCAPSRIARRLLSHLPDRLFTSVGSLLYKHIG